MKGVRSSSAGGAIPDSSPVNSSPDVFRDRGWDFWIFRLALVGGSVALCYALRPFGLRTLPAAGLGFFIAMVVLLAELRLRHAEISGLVGAAIGGVLGLLDSLLITLVVSRTAEPEPSK